MGRSILTLMYRSDSGPFFSLSTTQMPTTIYLSWCKHPIGGKCSHKYSANHYEISTTFPIVLNKKMYEIITSDVDVDWTKNQLQRNNYPRAM